MIEELFEKWKQDYLTYLQPKNEALVNAGELTQRRMKAAFLAGWEARGVKDCEIVKEHYEYNSCACQRDILTKIKEAE